MDKLLEIISEIDIPSAYDHFSENESPSPPFITYLLPGSDNFSADGRVYFRISEVHIELYTDEKNPETERLVENILDAHGIFITSLRSGLNPKNCTRFCTRLNWMRVIRGR